MSYKKYTGSPNEAAPLTKITLNSFLRHNDYKQVYIGATHDLESRFSEYSDWNFKTVLYETSFKSYAEIVEKRLVDYIENYNHCYQDPLSQGLPESEKNYYVYIVATDKINPSPQHSKLSISKPSSYRQNLLRFIKSLIPFKITSTGN